MPVSRTHRLASLALLAALAACGGAADVRVPDDAAPLLALLVAPGGQGAERLRAGDLGGARSAYEAALALDPGRLGALNDLAVAYALEGHGQAARRLLDEVVSGGDAREQQAALVNLGQLHASDGFVSAAQATLETARGLDPTRPEPWYALALLADARGDLLSARGLVREALRLDADGLARIAFAYVNPEERTHLDALVAEASGDRAKAAPLWRTLAAGRFASLSTAAELHLSGR
ncbi:MAG: tetratricopeptide repeat protein [Anaeromyxobacter sp.]